MTRDRLLAIVAIALLGGCEARHESKAHTEAGPSPHVCRLLVTVGASGRLAVRREASPDGPGFDQRDALCWITA